MTTRERKSPVIPARFITNVHESSLERILYSTLSKNIPELGISFKEAKNQKGRKLKNYLGVHVINPKKLNKIEGNPTIRFLKNPKMHQKFGKILEKNGELPEGTTEGLLSKYYNTKAIEYNNAELWLKRVNTPPIKKRVFENLIKKAIKNSLEK